MRKLFIASIIISLLLACNSVEPDNSLIFPLPAIKIDKIKINGKNITATIVVGTPTPCWYYYKTEKTQNESLYTAKIFGKYDGEPCIQILSSFPREEKVLFSESGDKKLKFWLNDSVYLDTVIVIK